MQTPLKSASALGPIIRAVRKSQNLRQDDAAGSLGVSENFLGKLEHGSESVQWGKVFAVLQGLGIRITLDVPAEAEARVAEAISKRSGP